MPSSEPFLPGRKTTRHLRMDSWSTVAGMTQIQGEGRFTWNDHRQTVDAGDLAPTNKSAGFWEYNRRTEADESLSFLIEVEQAGLPEGMVHAAMPRVRESPLTPLLLTQLRLMRADADADRLNAEPDVAAIGDAVVALVRGWSPRSPA